MPYRDRPNGPACINKYSATPGEVLPPNSLQNGEIAVNVDGTIYVRGEGGRSVAACGPGATVPVKHREYLGAYGSNFMPDAGEVLVNSEKGTLYVSNKVSPGGNANRDQRLRDGSWCQWSFNADGTKKTGQAAVDDFNSGTMQAWNPGTGAQVAYGVKDIVYSLKVPAGGVTGFSNPFFSANGTVEYWNSHSNAWSTTSTYTFPEGHFLVKARVVGSLAWSKTDQFNFGVQGQNDAWITSIQSVPFVEGSQRCCTLRGNVNTSGCVTFPTYAFNNGMVTRTNAPATYYKYLSYGTPRYFVDDNVLKADNNMPNDYREGTPFSNTFVPPVGQGGIDPFTHSGGWKTLTWPSIFGMNMFSTADKAIASIQQNCVLGDVADYLTVAQSDASIRGRSFTYQAELFRGRSAPPSWVTDHPSMDNCVLSVEYLVNAVAKHGCIGVSNCIIPDHDGSDIVIDVDLAGGTATAIPVGALRFTGTPGNVVNIVRNVIGTTKDTSASHAPDAEKTPRIYYEFHLPPGVEYFSLGKMQNISSSYYGQNNSVKVVNADGTRGKIAPITDTKGFFGYAPNKNIALDFAYLPEMDFEISNGPYFFGIPYFDMQACNTSITGDIRGKFKWSKGLTDLSQMVVQATAGNVNGTMATATYDGLLEEFAGLVAAGHFDNPVTLGVSTRTKYSAAAAAHRAYLVSQGWTITDGGQA